MKYFDAKEFGESCAVLGHRSHIGATKLLAYFRSQFVCGNIRCFDLSHNAFTRKQLVLLPARNCAKPQDVNIVNDRMHKPVNEMAVGCAALRPVRLQPARIRPTLVTANVPSHTPLPPYSGT